jgi:hypothetical protein
MQDPILVNKGVPTAGIEGNQVSKKRTNAPGLRWQESRNAEDAKHHSGLMSPTSNKVKVGMCEVSIEGSPLLLFLAYVPVICGVFWRAMRKDLMVEEEEHAPTHCDEHCNPVTPHHANFSLGNANPEAHGISQQIAGPQIAISCLTFLICFYILKSVLGRRLEVDIGIILFTVPLSALFVMDCLMIANDAGFFPILLCDSFGYISLYAAWQLYHVALVKIAKRAHMAHGEHDDDPEHLSTNALLR